MSSSRVTLRPRYGRIATLAVATSTTLVSFVGPLITGPAPDPASSAGGRPAVSLSAASLQRPSTVGLPPSAAAQSDVGAPPAPAPPLATAASTGLRASLSVGLPPLGAGPPSTPTPSPSPSSGAAASRASGASAAADAPPPDSGSGRRVVFSESEQRVWLVRRHGRVARSYLVSGSVYDNLDPGTYEVYSHSASATGIDGSALRWMVRFTQGDNAAIGFHSIPRIDGKPVQTHAQLGTPLSHGCIRQASPDAQALWRFAPVGTTVVVTA